MLWPIVVAVSMEIKHGSYLVTMTCIIIIFIDALSFLAFVVQSIVVGGNNSGDASWLLSMGEWAKIRALLKTFS